MVTIKNPMPFRIENHGVRVEHAEKTRSFTKSGRAKIAQGRPIFIKMRLPVCGFTPKIYSLFISGLWSRKNGTLLFYRLR